MWKTIRLLIWLTGGFFLVILAGAVLTMIACVWGGVKVVQSLKSGPVTIKTKNGKSINDHIGGLVDGLRKKDYIDV